MLREPRRKGGPSYVSGGGLGGAGVGGRAGGLHSTQEARTVLGGQVGFSQVSVGWEGAPDSKCLTARGNAAEEKPQRQRNGFVQPARTPCASWGRKSHGFGIGSEFAPGPTAEQLCDPGQVTFSEA